MTREQVFTLEATPLKFGRGAADEAGWDLERLGVSRAMLVSDPGVVEAGITERVRSRVEAAGVDVEVWDRARVEPTLESLQEAAAFAVDGGFDGFVAVGGGSSIDTAKAAALIASCGGELMAYVNPPVGEGRAPPERLRPLLAIPTTCGTGAEATSVAVLDVPSLRVKTGISHRYLRPDQAIVDPSLTSSLRGEVVASCGLDVICHAAESFVARPFSDRERPSSPADRPPYQGSTPISDVWSGRALEYGGRWLRAAVAGDAEARGWMMLAASLAGIGFGAAGVHIPHACAYPIAGLRSGIPHGRSVIVTAPAAFRLTFAAAPERHIRVAELLAGRSLPDADEDTLPSLLLSLMRDLGVPVSLGELAYGDEDVDALVEGALKQQRGAVGRRRGRAAFRSPGVAEACGERQLRWVGRVVGLGAYAKGTIASSRREVGRLYTAGVQKTDTRLNSSRGCPFSAHPVLPLNAQLKFVSQRPASGPSARRSRPSTASR